MIPHTALSHCSFCSEACKLFQTEQLFLHWRSFLQTLETAVSCRHNEQLFKCLQETASCRHNEQKQFLADTMNSCSSVFKCLQETWRAVQRAVSSVCKKQLFLADTWNSSLNSSSSFLQTLEDTWTAVHCVCKKLFLFIVSARSCFLQTLEELFIVSARNSCFKCLQETSSMQKELFCLKEFASLRAEGAMRQSCVRDHRLCVSPSCKSNLSLILEF